MYVVAHFSIHKIIVVKEQKHIFNRFVSLLITLIVKYQLPNVTNFACQISNVICQHPHTQPAFSQFDEFYASHKLTSAPKSGDTNQFAEF